MKSAKNLAAFIDRLRSEGELKDIHVELDPNGVIPEIQRRVVAENGPALLFHRVKGSQFPVITNQFGSLRRIELAFGNEPSAFIGDLTRLMSDMPPKLGELWRKRRMFGRAMNLGTRKRRKAAVLANRLHSLYELPALTSWPRDGGPFITLPLVMTRHPETGHTNLGMYRVQLQDQMQAGMHIQIHRGGGNHYHVAEQRGEPLPAAIFVGGPPALTMASIAPLPEDVPEVVFAALLQGRKVPITSRPDLTPLPILAETDFCILGQVPPHDRAPEGPFGDHYGYYSLCHDYPYMQVSHIFCRPGAVFPATVVGRPPQEDHFIAIYLQELFAPLFPLVMKGVRDVFAFEESGVHSAAGAIVNERYGREAFTACMRILGEGQLSLTKVLMATEAPIDPRHFKPFLQHIVARCDFRTDLFILSNISLDSLDYTGPKLNEGSKAIWLGLGPARFKLENATPQSFSCADFADPHLFCPGVLVVKGPPYRNQDGVPQKLASQPEIQTFRMVFLHDDPAAATQNDAAFLWHIFTRFEPAGDIYGRHRVVRNHLSYQAPLVIDCRMKPGYPDVLEADPETVAEVDKLWDSLGLD